MEPGPTTTRRLERRRDGRVIGGVSQGVAHYFGIDAVLVRIGFVIAAFFGGAGVIAYVAGWLLIPEEGETTSIGERALRERRWARLAGIALIAIAVSSVMRPLWWFGGHAFFAVLLIGAGVFLLSPAFTEHERTDAPPTLPTPATPATPVTPAAMQTTMPTPVSTTPPPPTTPVDIAFAPNPPPQPASPRRRRGGLGALTFGILLIGAGVTGLALASGASIEPANAFAVGLLVVGAALVVSTWVGRSFVLIPLGVVLVVLMSVSTVIDVPITGGIGEKRVHPQSVAELHPEYHHGIGEMRLDLVDVDFARGSNYEVEATVGIGHLLVRLPRGVTVEIHGHAGAGEVRVLDDHDEGLRVDRDTTLTAAGENPPHLVLDLQVGVGQVEVQDAAA